MSNTIALTYPEIHPGVVTSFTPGWTTTVSEIFRRAAAIVHTQAFQLTVETIAILSIFASLTIWAFAVSPSFSSL